MSRSMIAFCLAVLVGAWGSSALANPLPDLRLLPLQSAEELQSVLSGPVSPGFADALWQAEILGPEYTRLLVDLAQRDELELLFQSVIRGLAANGALEELEAIHADTTRPVYVRAMAREALRGALADSTAPSHLRGGDRALLAFRGEFVRFAFLLDDISSIASVELSTQLTHSIDPGEYRDLCDVLQTGSLVPAGDLVAQGELVFSLKDGREARLPTDGSTFGGIEGGLLSCPSLGAFIRQRAEKDHGRG